MAELNLKQIIDRLNNEFTGDNRKLVFWYDDKGEFAEDMDSVVLDNAKIYRLEPDNQFYTKRFLEREDTTTNYLIYATFPKPDAVYREMDRVNRTLAVNSGRGAYKAAKEAADIIASTKSLLLKLFNAEGGYDVVFAPSVTHALNQVIGGIDISSSSNIYCSPYEHNAVARPLHHRLSEAGNGEILLPLV